MNNKKIIVALDVDSKEQALSLVDTLGDNIDFYKIGSVMFTHYGPDFIKEIKSKGKKIFLDLKYHDIPNTVSHAVKEAISLDVDMLTVHTIGGFRMMKEAESVVEENNAKTIILGVTVLTSMKESDLNEMGINRKVKSQVKKLATVARNAGLKGVVCSAKELAIVKKVNPNVIAVVPGIRPADSSLDDQKRAVTPGIAVKNGADYLVIGRPIIKANDPAYVAEQINKEIQEVLK